jgi:transcriptional regulator
MYAGKENVPTWNYATVQVSGRPEIITDKKGIQEILYASVEFFEARNKTAWRYDLPPAFTDRLEAAIVGVKIKAPSAAKFKLGQNRNDEDYEAMLSYLRESDKPSDQELVEWMLKSYRIQPFF